MLEWVSQALQPQRSYNTGSYDSLTASDETLELSHSCSSDLTIGPEDQIG